MPQSLVAVQVTAVVPTAKVEPEAGLQVTVFAFVAVGVAYVTVAPLPPVAAVVMSEGQVIAGRGLTVTVKLQVTLPAPLVAVHVTVVVPTGKAAPLAKPAVCEVDGPAQLSAPTGAVKVTTFEHKPGSLLPVIFAGQVIVGNSLSLMDTVKLQVAVLPAASVTRKVFVVVPTGKAAPEAKPAVCVVVEPAQLSAPTGEVNVTTFEHRPGSLLPVIFAGQLIVGN